MKYEENPFEKEEVAKEWIGSVEGEEGMFRDKVIYPLLRKWIENNHPENVLEVGSGQGVCSDKLGLETGRYIGVEPSQALVQRSKELYGDKTNRDFLVGNAYDLPVKEGSIDCVFSVNVLFHLGDLVKASSELFRVLRGGGKFLIVTANPNSYDAWKSFYDNPSEGDGYFEGKVNTPVVPLSKNIFYTHTLENIEKSIERAGLKTQNIKELADGDEKVLFISIGGEK